MNQMIKTYSFVFFTFLYFFLGFIFLGELNSVSAQVVINEMGIKASPDWVEVYNYSLEAVDLSLYYLEDKAGNKLFLSGNVGSENYVSFDWSNRLDNRGDRVWLKLKFDGQIIEELKYGSEEGVCIPEDIGSNGSVGKITDGAGGSERLEWFSQSSRDKPNAEGTMSPCPTPTPLPTSTLTPIPSFTPVPVPTSTVAPAFTPIPTITLTKTLTSQPIRNLVTNTTTPETTVGEGKESVLSESGDIFLTPTPAGGGDDGWKLPAGSVLMIAGGVIFIFASLYPLIRGRMNIDNIIDVFKRKK